MNAANYNITIDRATDYGFVLTVNDLAGDPADISEVDFYGDIRETDTKRQAVEFTFALVTDGADGQVSISLPKEDTKLLREATSYEYDVFADLAAGRARLLEGTVTVRNNRTNDV